MSQLNPTELSPEKTERRNGIRVKGRGHYISYTGILRWGVSVFLVTTLWRWQEGYGWHVPLRGDWHLLFQILLGLGVWSVAGYLWGTIRTKS